MIGTTTAAVSAQFESVILADVESSGGEARFNSLSDAEVAAITELMYRTTGSAAKWVAIAEEYAPATGLRAKDDSTARIGLVSDAGPSPTIDQTIYEIYLEFRTAPVGSLSPAAAAWETVSYAIGNLTLAYGAGLLIGDGIDWFLQTFFPSVWDDIGGTINQILEEWGDYITDGDPIPYALQGEWEWQIDLDAFNVPSTDAENPNDGYEYGDWGDLFALYDYFDDSGGTGCGSKGKINPGCD